MITQTIVGKLGPVEKIDLDSKPGKGSNFSFLLYKDIIIEDPVRTDNNSA